MWNLLRQTVALVYPPTCPLCASRLPEERATPLCEDCDRDLPRQHPPFCRRCGLAAPGRWDLAVTCRACADTPPGAVERVLAPYVFAGGLREALHLVKYQGRKRLAAHLAARLAVFARGHLMDPPPTVVLPVPLHWQRLWRRGFNQAEWFARPVAEELGAPCETAWLTRRRPTPSQTRLRRTQRLRNLADALAVTDAGGRVTNARVLLVDDVVTTGATTEACARILRAAGAATVTVLAVAVTPRATPEHGA